MAVSVRMTKLRKDYDHIGEAPMYRPVSITVCTSAPEVNVRGLLDDLRSELGDKVDDVRFQQLPYNDVEKFRMEDMDIDVMLLCHSIYNRRFAITDVPDAGYDKFLFKVARLLGKEKIGVIVHDMASEEIASDEKYEEQMASFRSRQPSTFKHSSLVQICGQLGSSPVDVRPGHWTEVRDFVALASRLSPAKTLRDVRLPALIVFAFLIVLLIVIGLAVGL